MAQSDGILDFLRVARVRCDPENGFDVMRWHH